MSHLSTNHEIKFRVTDSATKRVIGYERLADGTWQRSNDQVHWLAGVFTDTSFLRDQSTNVYDKNRKEIFENDPISRANHLNHVVFRNGQFGMPVDPKSWGYSYQSQTLFPLDDKLEVVGRQ